MTAWYGAKTWDEHGQPVSGRWMGWANGDQPHLVGRRVDFAPCGDGLVLAEFAGGGRVQFEAGTPFRLEPVSWLAGDGPGNIALAADAGGRFMAKGPLMQFQMFDRQAAAATGRADDVRVQVKRGGRIVFNQAAAGFLREQYGAGPNPVVALLFSAESRAFAVRPLGAEEAKSMPVGTRWPLEVLRSIGWPVSVLALEFVDHYQIAEGEYPATLLRGPGPRMLVFTAPRRPPSS